MKYLLILFLLTSQLGMAQTFTSKERKIDAENILNTVINSLPFDSVYSQKRVYFLANELLTEDSPLVLKRKKCKAKILSESKAKNVKQYVVLGDFTIDWDHPIAVRVQLGIMPSNRTINFRLVKENDRWKIQSHIIFDE